MQVKASLLNEEVIVFLNDITKIKELERTSAKTRSLLFSSVAHELRTPLNSILPMCKILLGLVTDERAQRYLNIILNSAMHL